MQMATRLALVLVAASSVLSMVVLDAGPAGASTITNGSIVPDSVVPIDSYTPDSPFSSGQVVSVVVPANSVFAPGVQISIVECAAPDGVLPTMPSQCDGETLEADTILTASNGSIDYTDAGVDAGFTIYALPDTDPSTLGEASTSTPVCESDRGVRALRR